jgi:hypothetical protein
VEGEAGRVKYLSDQPWWTTADAAELEAIVHQMVESLTEHRNSGCATCAAGYPPCPTKQKVIQIVLDWREARIYLSKAIWERARQDRIDSATLREILERTDFTPSERAA